MLFLLNWRYERLTLKNGIKLAIFILFILFAHWFVMETVYRKNKSTPEKEEPVKVYKTIGVETIKNNSDAGSLTYR